MPDDRSGPDVPLPRWPRPDRYVLRAVVELDLALDAEGVGDDLGALLTRDEVAERVLDRMRGRLRQDAETPRPPDEEYGW